MGLWHSWLARILDMDEVAGSNPANPTKKPEIVEISGFLRFSADLCIASLLHRTYQAICLMDLLIRVTRETDIPTLIDIRGRTRENAIPADVLAAKGITEASWAELLRSGRQRGWVCLDGSTIVGFSQADSSNGEVVVLAVLPEYEARGIGRRLLEQAVAWLRECGCERTWLAGASDPNGRASGFYRSQGWRPTGERLANGDEILELGNESAT